MLMQSARCTSRGFTPIPNGAFAECLRGPIPTGQEQFTNGVESPLLSVSATVDRRGVEPLTSAVQILTSSSTKPH